jgi:hypothetical protein
MDMISIDSNSITCGPILEREDAERKPVRKHRKVKLKKKTPKKKI